MNNDITLATRNKRKVSFKEGKIEITFQNPAAFHNNVSTNHVRGIRHNRAGEHPSAMDQMAQQAREILPFQEIGRPKLKEERIVLIRRI